MPRRPLDCAEYTARGGPMVERAGLKSPNGPALPKNTLAEARPFLGYQCANHVGTRATEG